MSGLMQILVWLAACGVAGATLLALLDRIDFGDAGWLFDLVAHFPRQLVIAGLVVAVVAVVTRNGRAGAMAGAAGAINLAITLFPPPFAAPQAGPEHAAAFKVVSANVHGAPEALARLSVLAREYGANLVSVYEAPALSDQELAALFPGATVRAIRKSPDGRDLSKKMLAIASAPVEVSVTTTGGRSNRAVLRYALPVGDWLVQVTAAHPVSPDSPAGMGDRNRMLVTLANGLDQTQPFIVMGDFNASPWSRICGALPGARAGDPRLESTFPAFAPLIPIDHILFGGGLTLTDYRVGPDIGSDHLPLFATFALPG